MSLRRVSFLDHLRGPCRALLLWGALLGLLTGVFNLGRPLDDLLTKARGNLLSRPVSGDVVVLAIDDRSIRELGSWPWPRRQHARLVNKLVGAGARRIYFTMGFPTFSNPVDDKIFADSLRRAPGRVFMPVNFDVDSKGRRLATWFPFAPFRPYVSLVSGSFYWLGDWSVRQLALAHRYDGSIYPTISADLAERGGRADEEYVIDASLDPATIPQISVAEALREGASLARLKSKDVVVAVTSDQYNDTYYIARGGQVPYGLLHVLGAESLKAGEMRHINWSVLLIVALLLAWTYLQVKRRILALALFGLSTAALIVGPYLSDMFLIAPAAPALVCLFFIVGRNEWVALRARFRERAAVNPSSGLPTMNALRAAADEPGAALAAASIRNYAEIAATLPTQDERELVRQIVGRMKSVLGETRLFHGDAGVFCWLVPRTHTAALGDQLDALHGLFRAPVILADRSVDLDVNFGVDADGGRPLGSRIGSALVAAGEAAREGLRWKTYDPARLNDAEWRLSLLGRLDNAIDDGEVWVAFQPKLDLVTGAITGAEALVRWSHPEKGAINPQEFVLAAEQHNRIEKLTRFVLDRAIAAAARINERGVTFGIAVNLSSRLLENDGLIQTVSDLLDEHRLPPRLLTLEVTESATLAGGDGPIDVLRRLRLLGVQISIDDYGTGFSTLEYLRKIPATEIKLDRSFVQGLHESQHDRLMVNSTIQLAHSLERRIVAEGVETAEALQLLTTMGCDIAQGYLIAKPMALQEFLTFFATREQRSAA